MDATVDNFLKEINQIAPPKHNKEECDWQECLDKPTGYSYYWNIKTDAVTWEEPEEYKKWKSKQHQKSIKTPILHNKQPPKDCPLKPKSDFLKYAKKKSIKDSHSSDEDEKIVLISSYGEDSESEDEAQDQSIEQSKQNEKQCIIIPKKSRSKQNSQNNSEDEENNDLLSKIQTKVQILKDLGGDVPSVVTTVPVNSNENNIVIKKKSTGISLVAGYNSDSENDGEDVDEVDEIDKPQQIKSLFPIETPSMPSENTVAHSTLFPIPEVIDIKQFDVPKAIVEPKPIQPQAELLDSRPFQRKRKLDIGPINRPEKIVQNKLKYDDSEESSRLGLGFKSDTGDNPTYKGISFVKSDVLNPEPKVDDKKPTNENGDHLLENIDKTQTILREKLGFLCEREEPASTVQSILIQVDTLNTALKARSLNANYFHQWLKDTCEELVKLEKNAAPQGWLLQWDRQNKRYFYCHKETGKCQWDYPNEDVLSRDDDAMDISTTPPPPDDELSQPAIEVLPPPPPKISDTLEPPPPPIISSCERIPSDSKNSKKSVTPDQPLPPGVDPTEAVQLVNANQKEESLPNSSGNDSLTTALDSFYSDIAAMESQNQVPTPPPQTTEQETPSEPIIAPPKKKKVKLTQGLSMKKKGVSKLVEKWKNVQNSY